MSDKYFIPTQEFLLEHFEYKCGLLYWKKKTSKYSKAIVGSIVGNKANGDGYGHINIKNKFYKTHRLIFVYHYGYFPEQVDHINGNRLDNRIENLRACTSQENRWNSKTPITNNSGVKGVGFYPRFNKWRARCTFNKKYYFLGYFDKKEDAERVVNEFTTNHQKEFKRV